MKNVPIFLIGMAVMSMINDHTDKNRINVFDNVERELNRQVKFDRRIADAWRGIARTNADTAMRALDTLKMQSIRLGDSRHKFTNEAINKFTSTYSIPNNEYRKLLHETVELQWEESIK